MVTSKEKPTGENCSMDHQSCFIHLFISCCKRLTVRGLRKNDLIPFILPLIMLLFAPAGRVLLTLLLWLSIVVNMI
jgi:hypothetical protein